MGAVTVSQARQLLADLINRASYRGERTVIRRRGREVAAIVPAEDLELLQKLEDRLDLEEARKALAEPGTVSWEKLKARHSIKQPRKDSGCRTGSTNP